MLSEAFRVGAERQHLILRRALTERVVRIEDLAAELGVHEMTVRRDLDPARSFVGAFFMDTIARLHPDKVFFSAKAFSPETGFTDPHLPEVGAKQALIGSGSTVVALLDASKFARRALATIATLDQVDILVTDTDPPGDLRLTLDNAHVTPVTQEDS